MSSPIAMHVELVERLDRRLGLAFGERKVVKSCWPTRRCAAACMAAASSGCGTRQARPRSSVEIGAAIDDAIEIMALLRREARVEVVRHLLGRDHRDRMRTQMRVDGIAHRVGVPVLGEIDMRDLAERMHAGVGAPGAVRRSRPRRRTPRPRSASTPCTDGPLSWICQPTNGVPSYSMVSL